MVHTHKCYYNEQTMTAKLQTIFFNQLNFFMQLKQSKRQNQKIKMALQGASGFGKTYSALQLAYGITNDWSRIALIDSENGSSNLYSHLGKYQVLELNNPHTPENYVQAMEICEKSEEIEVIILDSISHCWEYLLDFHANLSGNSFQNWSRVTPRLKLFIDKILSSRCHVIATMRTKSEYVVNLKDGKHVPEKIGMKQNFRDGIEFEFTIVLDLDLKNYAIASKDRTNLFFGRTPFKITPETGKVIKEWCESGITLDDIRKEIKSTKSLEELTEVYKRYAYLYTNLEVDFTTRKLELKEQSTPISPELTNPQNFSPNGIRTL